MDIWFICPYLDYKIKQRHTLLSQTIGVKEEEIISYTNSHTLMVSVTVSMVALCILEYAAYMLYNRQVGSRYLFIILSSVDVELSSCNILFKSVPSLVENNQRRDC